MVWPVEIFCCYAREDLPLLTELKKQLMPLLRQRLINLWSDTDLNAGEEWEKVLHQHLDTAHIVLLFISPDFMASEYCYSVEMKKAIERHERGEARVIPVILKKVDWQFEPLNKLQALPTEAKPVTSKNWPDQNEALFDVAQGIRKVVMEIGEAKATTELYRREVEAWQNILGTRVEVKPLPDSVTPEVRRNLKQMAFDLRYVPKLDLGSADDIKRVDFPAVLQQIYPKWKPFESLSDAEKIDHTIPRNLSKWYWDHVRWNLADIPVLPGQWMAVETVYKPSPDERYSRTPFAEKLGFSNDRFDVSWDDVNNAINQEKHNILSDIGLYENTIDLRLLEAIEWNLLGNREGWGKTKSFEWTNTKSKGYIMLDPRRIIIGVSNDGGASFADHARSDRSFYFVGFRAAIVFNP